MFARCTTTQDDHYEATEPEQAQEQIEEEEQQQQPQDETIEQEQEQEEQPQQELTWNEEDDGHHSEYVPGVEEDIAEFVEGAEDEATPDPLPPETKKRKKKKKSIRVPETEEEGGFEEATGEEGGRGGGAEELEDKPQKKKKSKKTGKGKVDSTESLHAKQAKNRRVLGIEPRSSDPYLFPDQGLHISNEQLANGGEGVEGTAAAASPPDVFTSVPVDHVDWDAVEEDPHDPADDTFCADCEHDQDEDQREANPAVQEYRQHYEDNVLEVERTRLAAQTQALFKRKVYRYLDNPRYYTKRMIAEHHEEHAPTPAIIRATEFRTLNKALKVLRNGGLFQKNQNDEMSVEPKLMRLYITIMKERNSVMNELFNGRKGRGLATPTT